MINHKELKVKSVYKDKQFFSEANIIEDLIYNGLVDISNETKKLLTIYMTNYLL